MTKLYTMKEVSIALKTSEKTLLKRIRRGALKAQKMGVSWWIPQSALRKWILTSLGIPSGRRLCKISSTDGIISEQSDGKPSALNWYIHRGKPTPTGAVESSMLRPRRAAKKLQRAFRNIAWRLAPMKWEVQEDLVQEMSLAVLECEQPATRSYFVHRAKSRALNYLEYERMRGMPRMKRHPFARAPIRNEALLNVLAMAGIPVALLAQELGIVLDPEIELDHRCRPSVSVTPEVKAS